MSNSRSSALLLVVAALVACGGNGGGGGHTHNKPPVARFTLSQTSGPAPLTVTASGEASSDADGTITGYAWEFGDGSQATGPHAEHTYATQGEFLVTLIVTDDQGATGSTSGSLVVTGPSAAYDGSLFDEATYLDEPSSGILDSTPLQ